MTAAHRIQAIETLRRQMRGVQREGREQRLVPTGLKTLDSILPGGGLTAGSVIEWISEGPGKATSTLAFHAAAAFLKNPGCLTVIDEAREFCPTALPALGIPLSRLLVIHPGSGSIEMPAARRSRSPSLDLQSQTLWALEQTCRCRGVSVAVCWLDRCTSAVVRRLQLATEHSGVTLMLIRPAQALKQPSFADLRLAVSTHRNSQPSTDLRLLSVRVLRTRQGLQQDDQVRLTQHWSGRLMDILTGPVAAVPSGS